MLVVFALLVCDTPPKPPFDDVLAAIEAGEDVLESQHAPICTTSKQSGAPAIVKVARVILPSGDPAEDDFYVPFSAQPSHKLRSESREASVCTSGLLPKGSMVVKNRVHALETAHRAAYPPRRSPASLATASSCT